jgi:hypothetical protein
MLYSIFENFLKKLKIKKDTYQPIEVKIETIPRISEATKRRVLEGNKVVTRLEYW